MKALDVRMVGNQIADPAFHAHELLPV